MNPFPVAHLGVLPSSESLLTPFFSSTTSHSDNCDGISETADGEIGARNDSQALERSRIELHLPKKKNAIPVLRISRKLFSPEQLAVIDMQSRESSLSRTSRNDPQGESAISAFHNDANKPGKRKGILKQSGPPRAIGKRVKSEPVPIRSEQTTFPKQHRLDSDTGLRSIWEAIMQKKRGQNLSKVSAVEKARKKGRAGKDGIPGVRGKLSKLAGRPFCCTEPGCDKRTNHVHIFDNMTRSFECDIPNCGAKYCRKGDLKRHKVKKHRDSSLIICPEPQCVQRFCTPHQVAAHVRLIHHGLQMFSDNVPFPGDSAEMKNGSKFRETKFSALNGAEENVPSSAKAVASFQCSVKGCEKMFSRKYDCKRHIRQVHGKTAPDLRQNPAH